jgi:hypothetical protein
LDKGGDYCLAATFKARGKYNLYFRVHRKNAIIVTEGCGTSAFRRSMRAKRSGLNRLPHSGFGDE